jgi:DnaJ family protein A protein 2
MRLYVLARFVTDFTHSTQPDIPPGDVIFHIQHRPHPLFKPSRTSPANLHIILRIRLIEALTGFERVFFTHLDGRGIRLVSKRGERVIEYGQELAVKGEGLPRRGTGRRGDLIIQFMVEMPGVGWASRLATEVSDGLPAKMRLISDIG